MNPPRAKRSLGQNFLTDPNYIRKITDAVRASPADTIIEIGPGRGALTEKLVATGANVIAVEIDRELAATLRDRFVEHSNFKVIEANVLDRDLKDLARRAAANVGGYYVKVVANLPYYISTAILQRLAEKRRLFSELVLMFQREVVNRITAQPGNSDRGYLTVLVEAAFEVEKLFDVPPAAFSPRPKVWSSVVKLVPRPNNELDDERFRALLGTAFTQKRKTILNNLKHTYPNIERALASAWIEPRRRAETLSGEEWRSLFVSLELVRK